MQKLTFESLLKRAKAVFYDAWISEATPEECQYYIDYYKQYPNKGDYKTLYERALKKHVKILFSSWDYETPTCFYTPEELLKEIEAAENDYM